MNVKEFKFKNAELRPEAKPTKISITKFIIEEADIADLNLVKINDIKYPVYKDHKGYYILINSNRCNNGDYVTTSNLILRKDYFDSQYNIVDA